MKKIIGIIIFILALVLIASGVILFMVAAPKEKFLKGTNALLDDFESRVVEYDYSYGKGTALFNGKETTYFYDITSNRITFENNDLPYVIQDNTISKRVGDNSYEVVDEDFFKLAASSKKLKKFISYYKKFINDNSGLFSYKNDGDKLLVTISKENAKTIMSKLEKDKDYMNMFMNIYVCDEKYAKVLFKEKFSNLAGIYEITFDGDNIKSIVSEKNKVSFKKTDNLYVFGDKSIEFGSKTTVKNGINTIVFNDDFDRFDIPER